MLYLIYRRITLVSFTYVRFLSLDVAYNYNFSGIKLTVLSFDINKRK